MAEEKLNDSLQEAVLAVLAFNEKHGALIEAQVLPENFDGVYRDIASAVINYRRKYRKAPGAAHLGQVFSSAQLDPSNRAAHTLRRTLVTLSAQADSLNPEYIVNRTQDFLREQNLKSALVAANERYVQGGDDTVIEVESILSEALKFRSTTYDAGTRLSDYKHSSVFAPHEDPVYSLGIPQLDHYGIGLSPKRLMLYIAPKNSGKSWLCVQAGRQALLQRAKVLHVTLEMPEEEVIDRYYQSFFGIATRPGQYTVTKLELDTLERVTGLKVRRGKPKLDFTDPNIQKLLRQRVQHWGSRFNNLVIKEFASGTLTMNQLRGYLDYLDTTQNFIPNVLIVDYPDLFKIPTNEFRLALGRVFVDLRGLGGERNMAIFAPTQANREGIGAKRVTGKSVSEDISKVFTADTVLTYSQTEAEEQFSLARLRVEFARRAPKGTTVLLSQAYTIGQYVLQSALLPSSYWDTLEAAGGRGAASEASDED